MDNNTKITKEIIETIRKLEYVSDSTVIKNITFSSLASYPKIADWTIYLLRERYYSAKDCLIEIKYSSSQKKNSTELKQQKVKLILDFLEEGYDTRTIQRKLDGDYNICMSENSINKEKSKATRLLSSLMFPYDER